MQLPLSSTLNITDKTNMIVVIGTPVVNTNGSFALRTTARIVSLNSAQSQIVNALYEEGIGSSIETIPEHLHQEAINMVADGLLEVFSTTTSTVFKENYVPNLLMSIDETTLTLDPNAQIVHIKHPRSGKIIQLPSIILEAIFSFTPHTHIDTTINETAKRIVEENLRMYRTDLEYQPAIEDFTFQLRTVLLMAAQAGIISIDLEPKDASIRKPWERFIFNKK